MTQLCRLLRWTAAVMLTGFACLDPAAMVLAAAHAEPAATVRPSPGQELGQILQLDGTSDAPCKPALAAMVR